MIVKDPGAGRADLASGQGNGSDFFARLVVRGQPAGIILGA